MTTTEFPSIPARDIRPGAVFNDGQYVVLDIDVDHIDGVVAHVRFSDGGDGWRSWDRDGIAVGVVNPS